MYRLTATELADEPFEGRVRVELTATPEVERRRELYPAGSVRIPTDQPSGDLAVLHPDGYIEVKDRAKDVIISGGENISSLEVEETLYRQRLIDERLDREARKEEREHQETHR